MINFDFSIIQYLRQKRGLSREQLANACNISRQTVANIENCKSIPAISIVMKIAEALDVKYDELINYARRSNTSRVKALEFRIPGQLSPGLFFEAGQKAIAYMDLLKGVSYRLKRYQVQIVYVIDGEIAIECHCCSKTATTGQYVSCDGVDCQITAVSGNAKVVSVFLPNPNPAADILQVNRKPGPDGLFTLIKNDSEMVKEPSKEFDFSVIKVHRQAKGISLAQLAQGSGIAIASLTAIEQGKKHPSFQTLEAIVNCLGISLVDYLKLVRKGCCNVRDTIRASMDGTNPDSSQSVTIPLMQMKYQRYRLGYLSNDSGQTVVVPEKNMYVVEEKFIIVIDGSQTINVAGKAYEISAGQGLVFDGRGIHNYKIDKDNSSFALFSVRPGTIYDDSVYDDSRNHTLFLHGDIM